MSNQSYVSDTTNQGIECPERKEGNKANASAARGRPVAMATQEIHYVSMAQLVESSPNKETMAQDGIFCASFHQSG
jgi:hypothetical protein